MAFLSSFYPQPVVAGTTAGTYAEGDHTHSAATQSFAGFLSTTDKTKLDAIQAGAEANVNADWNATSGDAQILNKPSTFPPSSHTHPASEISDSTTAGRTLLLAADAQAQREAIDIFVLLANRASFPSTGQIERAYIAGDTGKVYGWVSSVNAYIELSPFPPVELVIACSDETTNLTTGTAKVTFRAPHAFKLSAVRASVNTAPTGSALIVDINNGANSTLSTKLSIDASEKTSTTAATAAVIDTDYDDISDDAEITIDIDQIGSTIAGKGLKVVLIGTRV